MQFNIKRFGKYLTYDLINAKNNFGLSLLIWGGLPVLIFLFNTIMHIIGMEIDMEGSTINTLSIIFGTLGVCFTFGSKTYGTITDRRAGSQFIMIPASPLEKTLSIVLIACVAVPVCFFATQTLSNAAVSIFVKDYGSVIPTLLPSEQISRSDLSIFNDIGISIPLCSWLNWCENALAFTLGAICFKKQKIGKTILCYFAFMIILVIILSAVFQTTSIGSEEIRKLIDDFSEERVISAIRIILSSLYALVIGGLLAGLYFRVKTIKH